MPSKPINCQREFSDGSICGRPIKPIYGTIPEECSSCAIRIAVNTKDGREAFRNVIEESRARIRSLAVAGAEPSNIWHVDGLKLRFRFQMLDKLEARLNERQTMMAMNVAKRLAEKETTGKLTNEIRRTSLGHMWKSISPERAVELKQKGFETRFIGVAWQVKVS